MGKLGPEKPGGIQTGARGSVKRYVSWVGLGIGCLLVVFFGVQLARYFAVRGAVERCTKEPSLVPDEIKDLGGPARTVKRLTFYLRFGKPTSEQRAMVAEMLGACAKSIDDRGIEALIEMLHDPSQPVRVTAASSLGDIRRRTGEIVPALAGALEDSNHYVRLAAADSLKRIGADAEEALPNLIRGLQDDMSFVRTACVRAIASIGPGARDALPALKELRDREGGDRMRRIIDDAIAQISKP